jgi:halimadienyl-diphosphate synthase
MLRNIRAGEITSAVHDLLLEMVDDLEGEFLPSVYETGRLVRHCPSLSGHAKRVDFLLRGQRRDGGWGGPGGYGLVPTLSATEALLSELQRSRAGQREDVADAVGRGLKALEVGLKEPLPDTVAVELIVPSLVNAINDQLGSDRLRQPDGVNSALLAWLGKAVIRRQPLPTKLHHSLEVLGESAQGAPSVAPVGGGVGCSPAATAVWLGDRAVRARRHPSVHYLESVQRRGGGPVPVATPLALFERAWVLATLASAGVPVGAPRALVHGVRAAFGKTGTAGGPGLPPDADDTATALSALARLGDPRSPECLWNYQDGSHFVCFPAERTPSTSTNAHVLQAFGASIAAGLPGRDRYLAAMARITRWLCDQQGPDGCWWDKWHASPYYATACCALALRDHGGTTAAGAVRKAVAWVLDTQHRDGSWGRWAGTYEETAYAVQILMRTKVSDPMIEQAVARGCAVLVNPVYNREHPPLWHDKDLYTPVRIVRAEGLAALYLARANPAVAARHACIAGNQA